MIEVITPDHHRACAPLMESMFRMRYRALVERCGWHIPDLAGGRDCDQYDTEDTTYIIECAPGTENVVACARLNPTVKPHMLSELFARFCDLQGVPTGETIYEASRIAIDAGRLERSERMEVLSRLEAAATAYALRSGIKMVTSFISEKVYLHNIQLWSTRPLGLPAYFEDDGRTYIPAISVMDEAALERIEERRRQACAGVFRMPSEIVSAIEPCPYEQGRASAFRRLAAGARCIADRIRSRLGPHMHSERRGS